MVTHSSENLRLIDSMLKAEGVDDYRFCIENDCYVCDVHGNFYSVCKRQMSKIGNVIELYRLTKLKGSVDKYGYITYRVLIDGEKKHLKAHRMMMNAWFGEEPNLVVNHIDGNKKNNELSNLEWCTVSKNNAHAIETGLFDPHKAHKHTKIPVHEWMSIYILNKHCGYSLSELGRMNHCGHDTIKKIVTKLDRVMQGVAC